MKGFKESLNLLVRTSPNHCVLFERTLPNQLCTAVRTLPNKLCTAVRTLPNQLCTAVRTLPNHCVLYERTLPNQLCAAVRNSPNQLCTAVRTLPNHCVLFERTLPNQLCAAVRTSGSQSAQAPGPRPSVFSPVLDSPTRTEPNTIHMIKWGQTQGWKQGNTNASSGGHATRALSRGERRGNRPQGFTWFAQVPVLKGATPGPQGRRRGGGRPPAGRASPGGQKRSQVSGFATRYLLPQTLL